MMVSFIVPAHNEAEFIGSTLDAIADAATAVLGAHQEASVEDAHARGWEIVVVADGCSDATVEVATAHPGPVRVLEVQLRQIAAVRNAGARAARGEVFIFVDADTQPDAQLLRATLDALSAGPPDPRTAKTEVQPVVVGGGCHVRFDRMTHRWARLLARFSAWGYRRSGLAAGCYLFVRRQAFEAVGGFDERWFATEEVWLSRALARHGEFVVLPETVLTSARKIEHLTAWQMLALLFKTLSRGVGGLKQREGLDIWYVQRETSSPGRSTQPKSVALCSEQLREPGNTAE